MKNNSSIKINALFSIVVLVLGLSAGAVFAQTNMLVNGSFESGGGGIEDFPGWDQIGPADNNSDYGVAQSSVYPDVAEDGNFYAYFHGHPTDSSQDCLGQTVHLTVGAQYTISYYLATDGTTFGSGAAMYVVIGTSFGIDYSQDLQLTDYEPNSSNALPYQKFTTTITASNATEILSFHGFDASSAILVDNVIDDPGRSVRAGIEPQPFPNQRAGLHLDFSDQRICPSGQCVAGDDQLGDVDERTGDNWLQQPDRPTRARQQLVLPSQSAVAFFGCRKAAS